jgi:Fe2+ transport system protein FeoA
MPLSSIRRGSRVRIENMERSSALGRRLAEMGILAGEVVDVLRNEGPCPLVLGLGDARLMLGKTLGDRIEVSLVETA